MAFNYNAAKQAGFTDEQIGAYMRMKGVTAPQKKSVAGFMGNIVKSGIRAGVDLGGAAVNTVNPDKDKNTLVNMMRLGQGVGQMLDPTKGNKIANASNKATSYILPFMAPMLNPGNVNYEDYAKNVGKFYKDRYGGVENITNTLYNDPVGVGLDVASLASGAGAGLKASGLAKAGNAFSKAAKFTDPFSMAGKVGSKAVSGSKARLAKNLSRASEDIVTRGIGNPAAQAKAAKKAGRSVSSFIDEYNLYDRSPESASLVKKGIMSNYDELAMKSGKSVQMAQIMKAFDAEISRLSKGVNGVISEADRAKIAELIKRRDMLLEASGATYHSPMKAPQRLTIQPDGTLKMQAQPIDPALTERFVSSVPINVGTDTLTNFRRNVIDPDVPQSMYNLDARGSGAAQGVKQARDIVKSGIDSTDPRLAKLGKDYGMAKSVEKILTQADARGQNRQMFNFTKLGGAGVGGIISGAPGVVTGFALESMVNHPKFIAGASKTMKAGSKALLDPRMGKIVNKTGRVASPVYSYARAGRMTNNALNTTDQKTPISTNRQTAPQRQSIQQQSLPSRTPAYTPMPKLPPVKTPKPSKDAQAFSGNFKLKRGSFY